MDLKLYKVNNNDFVESISIEPTDLVIVENNEEKTIYVYKNPSQSVYDEFESQELYDMVLNQFLNPQIILLKSLHIGKTDSDAEKRVKSFITAAFPNKFKMALRNFFQYVFGFKQIRKDIQIFKNYEHSGVWRRRLSNQTNIWKLSLFNVISSLSIMILSLLLIFVAILPVYRAGDLGEGFEIWLQNLGIYQSILIAVSGVIFVINLIFLLFPLRFPIKPKKLEQLK
ncbi:MAG: hypothetical protein ACTSRK_14980 [Promethearchaeota archaeon]